MESRVSKASLPIMASENVYILVVTYRLPRTTIECVTSLLPLCSDRVRILIIENGSPDNSFEVIRAGLEAYVPAGGLKTAATDALDPAVFAEGFQILLVRNETNIGFGRAINVLARFVAANTDDGYFWILNNDVIAEPGSLNALVDTLASRDDLCLVGSLIAEMARPTVVQEAGGELVRSVGWCRPLHRGEAIKAVQALAPVLPTDWVCGASVLVSIRDFMRVGGFCESYFVYWGDVDLSFLLRASTGRRCAVVTASVIRHISRAVDWTVSDRVRTFDLAGVVTFYRRWFPWLWPFVLFVRGLTYIACDLWKGGGASGRLLKDPRATIDALGLRRDEPPAAFRAGKSRLT
ncbi:MAG: glycosyltransferase family 2 protein [Defluviicoccus sp.]